MKKIIKITGMECEHCKKRVENALTALGAKAAVDLKYGTATVENGDKYGDATLRDTVEALGFDVVSITEAK